MTLDDLAAIIADRRGASVDASYTAKLLSGGVDRIGKKIGEEAVEFVLAAKDGERNAIAHEASDLFYHALVLLEATGVPLTDIYAELDRRHRAPRPLDDGAAPNRNPE
ncbi:MAG: phosphoribosyl-ATP diphosphatase [bacterium]|nr:phosphoribosyl-ATP diphosphatase [bacterium]